MCGLRVSEALSLKVDDIDFSLNCLSVRKAKSDIVTEDIGISTHDLTKRSTHIPLQRLPTSTFQLTTSRRGRPLRYMLFQNHLSISTHDLTKRSTAEHVLVEELLEISTHDLTKRSTKVTVPVAVFSDISTHDLTKRST